jgi:hypothetical protein
LQKRRTLVAAVAVAVPAFVALDLDQSASGRRYHTINPSPARQEALVTSFTFSVEQVRSAPPEVRDWMQDEIAAALLAVAKARPEAGKHTAALAVCTADEALRLFEMIRGNFAAAQVFLELALAAPVAGSNLYALETGRILRRARLSEDRLLDRFRMILEVFQQLRQDPAAALLGFDQNNHVFIDAATNHNIRNLWQELVAMRAAMLSAPVPSPSSGFISAPTPPQRGDRRAPADLSLSVTA